MNTTKENNVIENHLFQMDVIRKSFTDEEIAREIIEDEINRDHALDGKI